MMSICKICSDMNKLVFLNVDAILVCNVYLFAAINGDLNA